MHNANTYTHTHTHTRMHIQLPIIHTQSYINLHAVSDAVQDTVLNTDASLSEYNNRDYFYNYHVKLVT